MTLSVPANPYRKDAEAAGKYAVQYIAPKHRAYRDCPVDVIYVIARWAAHWANLALKGTGHGEDSNNGRDAIAQG